MSLVLNKEDINMSEAFQIAQNTIFQRRANLGYQNYLTAARNYNFQRQMDDVYSPGPYAILGHNTFHSFPVSGTFNSGGNPVRFNYGTGYVMENHPPHIFIAPSPRYQGYLPPVIIPLGRF